MILLDTCKTNLDGECSGDVNVILVYVNRIKTLKGHSINNLFFYFRK